ncbi:MAG: DUF4129 domain-containing protein [Pirellulaceae bacterium]
MARQAKSSSPLDAIAVAVSTGLIIGMVGSLIFFLIVAFYRGQYDTRLMYIFGLYTVATVLIARIAIDHGRAYANAFSLPLAVVSMLSMLRFVTFSGPLGPLSWIVNVALLAVAWYLADRITFDCTQVSERERSVQQGLLQSLGMLKLERVASPTQLLTAAPATATAATNANRRIRKHSPGVWILYFALLAIPLFGLGQLAIPAADQRSRAFMFLIVYLACALSLLVLTALLGMQRYLRQRGVAMPVEMGTRWIGIGVGAVMLLLLLCLVLPLPGRSLGLIGLPSFIQSPEGLSMSRWGWGKAGPQSDAGESSESSPPASRPPDNEKAAPAAKSNADPNPDPNAKSSAESDNAAHNQSAEVESDGQRPSDGKQAQTQREQRRPSERQREQPQLEHEHEHEHEREHEHEHERGTSSSKMSVSSSRNISKRQTREPNESVSQPAPEPKKSSPPSWFDNLPNSVANLIKWLTLAVLAMIIVVYLVTHPGDIARLWRELQAWWGKLWGGRGQGSAQPTVETADAEERSTRRPFASFANPFAGQLSRWSPAEVVVHSFAALEAWAAERGRPRRDQETTAEFARHIARGVPAVAAPAQQAAQMLDQLMFAGWQPQLSDVQPLADLWHALGR